MKKIYSLLMLCLFFCLPALKAIEITEDVTYKIKHNSDLYMTILLNDGDPVRIVEDGNDGGDARLQNFHFKAVAGEDGFYNIATAVTGKYIVNSSEYAWVPTLGEDPNIDAAKFTFEDATDGKVYIRCKVRTATQYMAPEETSSASKVYLDKAFKNDEQGRALWTLENQGTPVDTFEPGEPVVEYINPDVTATYRLQHYNDQILTIFADEANVAKLNHWGNGSNPANEQFLQFEAVSGEENVYIIKSISANKYIAIKNEPAGEGKTNIWDVKLVDDKTLAEAKFKLEKFNNEYVYIYSVFNDKYAAPDETGPNSPIYFDKGKTDKAKWKLLLVDDDDTSHKDLNANDMNVFVQDGYIKVQGVENFKVYSITGAEVNINTRLNTGIYIISANGKQCKVLVK